MLALTRHPDSHYPSPPCNAPHVCIAALTHAHTSNLYPPPVATCSLPCPALPQAAASAAAAYARAHGASHQLFASSQPGTPVKQHSALGGLQASSGALRHRSGAHLLFAAWLSAHGGQRFFNDATCHGWCFRSSWAMRVGTIE